MYIHIWYTQELKVPWTFIPSFFFWPPRPNLKMTHFSFRFNIHSVSPHTDSRPLYFFASSLMTNLIFSSFYHCCCFFLVFLLTVVVQSCPQTIPDSHPHLHFLCYLKLTTVSHVAVTRRQVIRMQSCPLLIKDSYEPITKAYTNTCDIIKWIEKWEKWIICILGFVLKSILGASILSE